MESQEKFTDTLSYFGTCLSMLCGGTTSLFATYGSSFSEILGFTQYETNMVASLGDYAHYMSAPLFGYLSSRLGPTRIIQAAGVLMFCGYLGLSYAFQYLDAPKPSQKQSHYVASMSLLFALVGVGSKAAYMSSMATTASNFKHSRFSGIALGIPLSLYGLSTFVFSSVKARWFERDPTPSRYLTFMAFISAAAHLLAACFVLLKDTSQLAVAGAARRRAQSAAKSADAQQQQPDQDLPSAASSSEAIEMSETRRRRMTTTNSNDDLPPISDGGVDTAAATDAATGKRRSSLGTVTAAPQITPLAPANNDIAAPAAAREPPIFHRFRKDPTAWVLLLGLICFSGPGLAFVNNCGTMVRAMSHTSTLTEEQVGQYKDKIVATQSFFSFASRLAIGYFSDVWRTRLRLPRSGLLVASALLMIYAQTRAAQITRLDELYPLAVLIGVSMGSVFTLAPTITSETWGANNFGICWGIITLGPAVGGHICNLIFGFSWDEGLLRISARMGPETPQDRIICDNECFVPAFVTTTKIAFLSLFFFTAVLLMPRILVFCNYRRHL
ncbi:hypothetical protein IWW36_003191 [Coemansia brasiliensis]|uniref:Probable transporter MCH1 n=1 Tax=Coemansia brasiliensis TaxID=2650707 RepID=A0A9W8LZ79_9FUNG|nr:hypothetical protein IWW36_003191 [Coemansia brasiliensis]